jgi:hypothetical protein
MYISARARELFRRILVPVPETLLSYKLYLLAIIHHHQILARSRCYLPPSIGMQSLSYPPVKPAPFRTIIPRPTIPVYPPPEPLQYPNLPCKPRQVSFHPQFSLSTHIVPATHLRTVPYEPLPPPLSPTLSKPERMAYYEELCLQLRTKLGALAPSSGQPRVLWNCLNRFVRKEATGSGLTLFLAHANGFPKEVRYS